MSPDLITKQDCEKTQNKFMGEIKEIKKQIIDIRIDIAQLPEQLIEKLNGRYVSQEAFKPVQKIVYGLVGAILFAVLVAILALVIE